MIFIMLLKDRKLGVRIQNTAKNISRMGKMPKFLVILLNKSFLGASLTATSLSPFRIFKGVVWILYARSIGQNQLLVELLPLG